MDEKCHGCGLDLLNMEGAESVKKSEAVITSASPHPSHTMDTGFSGLHISQENFLVFSSETVCRKDLFALLWAQT